MTKRTHVHPVRGNTDASPESTIGHAGRLVREADIEKLTCCPEGLKKDELRGILPA
jgi:hypothetical protein